jgi:spore coat polysaccharide biosynthesis predicted glycosyltransferase SpsG
VPPHCRSLCGIRYALLNPGFAALRDERPDPPDAARRRLLVTLGASDPAGATERVLAALAAADVDACIDVVLGRYFPRIQAVRALCASLDARVHVDVADMARLMRGARAAIAAAGVTALELCCLGVPSLLLVTADNQLQNARGLEALGAARACAPGLWTDTGTLAEHIRRLWRDESGRRCMARRAREACDAHGAARAAAVIAQVHAAAQAARAGARGA